ncbi:hypothetical protein CTAYLR_006853 [Chrysophaeum taylorii]|uniref:Cleft lip and palate associated transmembrane protein n=1 Tax=Chrysophaeum taylorii TaxID=2483200 RepID=A0AAD7XEP8_9STRA|nr:hypothetical protein CTAYLR_006853 [Chrysophaeum taylorii]
MVRGTNENHNNELSTRVATATIGVTDKVAYVVSRFMVCYLVLCGVLLRQLARRPSCSPSERAAKVCLWPMVPLRGGRLDLFVVITTSASTRDEVAFARYDVDPLASFDAATTIAVPPIVRKGGVNLVAHFYARPSAGLASSENETAASVVATSTSLGSVALTRAARARARTSYRSLLDTTNDTRREDAGEWRPHWKFGTVPLVVRVLDVGGDGALSRRAAYEGLPNLGVEDLRVFDDEEHGRRYPPIALLDEQSVPRRLALPMSRNVSRRPHPTFRWRYRVASPLAYGLRATVAAQIIEMMSAFGSDKDVDDLRVQLSDDRIFRYVVSTVIGMLHVQLDYFAFREEVGFYVGRETFRGVSTSSLLWGLARSVIVFLFLADNDANILLLITLGRAVLTECWKVARVLRPTIVFDGVPSIRFRDLHNMDAAEKYTARLDRECTAHLGLGLAPLVVGFSVFALVHYLHKSWYSWLVSSLADLTYFFGFLAMVPQLYINYKLKSVAHLPLKVFLYKVFNTFVDDAFAWIVKSPIKYRIMTLRDDLVFLVFLWQYWAYQVDKARPNEFGLCYEKPLATTTNPDDPVVEGDSEDMSSSSSSSSAGSPKAPPAGGDDGLASSSFGQQDRRSNLFN